MKLVPDRSANRKGRARNSIYIFHITKLVVLLTQASAQAQACDVNRIAAGVYFFGLHIQQNLSSCKSNGGVLHWFQQGCKPIRGHTGIWIEKYQKLILRVACCQIACRSKSLIFLAAKERYLREATRDPRRALITGSIVYDNNLILASERIR